MLGVHQPGTRRASPGVIKVFMTLPAWTVESPQACTLVLLLINRGQEIPAVRKSATAENSEGPVGAQMPPWRNGGLTEKLELTQDRRQSPRQNALS